MFLSVGEVVERRKKGQDLWRAKETPVQFFTFTDLDRALGIVVGSPDVRQTDRQRRVPGKLHFDQNLITIWACTRRENALLYTAANMIVRPQLFATYRVHLRHMATGYLLFGLMSADESAFRFPHFDRLIREE